ncbi:Ig-like domain-containing protein [Patescibacteria group bacterium]|nr:Ig-like domain-containing protein [Patescibacteria group bacterium]
MENENPNTNLNQEPMPVPNDAPQEENIPQSQAQTEMPLEASAEPEVQAETARPKKRWLQYTMFSLLALVLAGVGYVGYTNPQIFRAAITELAELPAGGAKLYIPNYEAAPGDNGNIAVKTKGMDVGDSEQIHSMQFTVKYEPVNAMTFNENSIVFDQTTAFQSADLKGVNTNTPGQVILSFFSNNGAVVDANDITLFKLNVDVSGPAGSSITMEASDVEVVIKDNNQFVVSDYFDAIDAGSINLITQADLRVLNAEALDSTHVLVRFSDLLSQTGTPGFEPLDYFLDGCNGSVHPSNVESGFNQGYDQSTVVLTTAAQNPGVPYLLCVMGNEVKGNVDGPLDDDYRQASYFGFGQAPAGLSDFNMLSAQATAYKKIQIAFSDPVEVASVSADSFTVEVAGGAGNPVLVATANDDGVELTVNNALLKRNTYIVTVDDAVKRASDNEVVGVSKIAVSGYKNGPRLLEAVFTDNANLSLTFDENIVANGVIGEIVVTGQSVSVAPLADYTVSGSTITVAGLEALNSPDGNEMNYTVILNANVGNGDMAVDPDYNRAGVWEYGSVNGPNGIGAIEVTRKNTIEISPGTVAFAAVDAGDVQVMSYDDNLNKTILPVSDVSVTAEGKLVIVTSQAFNPENHYLVRVGANPSMGVGGFALETFEMVSAQATEKDKVMVTFSGNIDQSTISANAFDIDGGLSIDSVAVQPGFTQVLLSLSGDMNAGQVYVVQTDTGPGGVRSFFGGKTLTPYAGAFAGYQTLAGQSDVQLDSIDVNSSTELMLHFSGNLTANTVTPINIRIERFVQGGTEPLTITAVEMVDESTVRLTTNNQVSDANYFVGFAGVKDEGGLLLGNTRVLNFFGYTVPPVRIGNLTPNAVSNEVDQVIVVLGENLDTIVEARLGNTVISITEQTAGALSLIVPAGFESDIYNLTLVNQAGETEMLPQALAVTIPEQPMRIVSDNSRAIPNRVPPDGETEITFWVQVEDPLDLANVDSVAIDLEQIGGNRAQEMEKDTGLQPRFKQYYTFTTTVNPVTPTQDEPYQLAVEVKKGAEAVQGTVSLYVTRDVLASVAPVFDQVYVNPGTVPPDGLTEVTISAKVTDPDGANTITSVVADLGPLGIGFISLNKLDVAGQADEQVTGWYASDTFTVPEATQEKNYILTVSTSDTTGESSIAEINLNVSTALTGPSIDPARSYIGPRKSVPKDDKTPFSIHVMVGDPNGVADIDTVNAYFGTLGLSPVTLLRDPNASENAKKALYSSSDITIPRITPMGVHEIEVIATDQGGGTGSIILQVDVTEKDMLGDAPLIFSDKAYTNPKLAKNDGQTSVTLYAFVRDDDDDLDSVVVNLSSVGQVGAEAPADFQIQNNAPIVQPPAGGNPQATCPTGSNTIVCMQPSFKEGSDGQWFILPDVVISSNTPSSSQPYEIEVIATDLSGKTARGKIRVLVSDSEGFADNSRPPQLIAAVPVSETAVEVVFSEEMAPLSLSANGNDFVVTARNDISQALNVLGATISATGDVVTVTTVAQEPGKEYMLSAGNQLTDISGVSLVPGQTSRTFFKGFEESAKPPVVHYVAATDVDTVEVEFQDNLRPSSVKTGEGQNEYDIEILESETSIPLSVKAVRFIESGKLLEIKTEQQKSGQRYQLQIKDIASAAGIKLKSAVAKFFKAIKLKAIQQANLSNAADLNGDGKVDFIDFTMFSSVYGQVFINAGGADAQGLNPILPDPDSLVPHNEPVL